MRIDRRAVPDVLLMSALEAVPEELGRKTKLAENGLAFGIEELAEMLLAYAAARTVEIDPRFETRETWLALTSAASLYRDYVRALTVPAGGVARAFVDYLGVGFGFYQEADEVLRTSDWIRAYQLALVTGKDDVLNDLRLLVASLPADDDLDGFRAFWGRRPAEAYPDSLQGRMLRAIAEGDAVAFNAALAAALERHRERAERPRDLIAWGPLAMATLAHDAGIRIEVESGYLPERLVTGAGPKKPGVDGPIARPDFEPEHAAGWLENCGSLYETLVERAFDPKLRLGVSMLADEARDALLYRSVLDPRAESAAYRDELELASAAWAAVFRHASAPRGTAIAITLAGRTGEVPAAGPDREATDWNYARAVTLAWASRRQADIAILAAVDPDDLAPSTPETNSYARACHAVLRGQDPRPQLRAALAVSSGDEHWECLRIPRVRVLERIAENDADGFNAALAEMLGLYRDYYTSGSRIGDSDGQLSFDALGLACLAHDRGLPVRVESDYLPRAVIEGLRPH